MGDHCWREPSLSQMLADPLTRILMQSDGVDLGDLRDLIAEVRQRIAAVDRGATRGD
jgi:hypothetical protein